MVYGYDPGLRLKAQITERSPSAVPFFVALSLIRSVALRASPEKGENIEEGTSPWFQVNNFRLINLTTATPVLPDISSELLRCGL